MNNKDKLITDYVEIFEKEESFGTWIFDDSGKEVMKAPYQRYSDSVDNFIRDFKSLMISDNNYMDNVIDIEIDQDMEYFDHLSEQDCITVLTTFMRRERFGQGFSVNALENGNIIKVLKRL